MPRVYSAALLDLQEYLKHVEINGNRGIVYAMVTELLIKLVQSASHYAMNGGEMPTNVFRQSLAIVRHRYTCLDDPQVYKEVKRIITLIMTEREDLATQFACELMNTSELGGTLRYNVVDLVACQYHYDKTNESL